jgi:hypothetical protein
LSTNSSVFVCLSEYFAFILRIIRV